MPTPLQKSIRIPVTLVSSEESISIDGLPPLTAVPSDKLTLLEEIAELAKKIHAAYSKNRPDSAEISIMFQLMRELRAKLDLFAQWES